MSRGDGSILYLVLEVKGMEDNVDGIRISATRKWMEAVNSWGKFGAWEYAVVKDLTRIEELLNSLMRKEAKDVSEEKITS